ncbi:hypothetical protein MMC22_001176 [Lobaria immixta]|nr:hypothetical protein [Lobaria immixta]
MSLLRSNSLNNSEQATIHPRPQHPPLLSSCSTPDSTNPIQRPEMPRQDLQILQDQEAGTSMSTIRQSGFTAEQNARLIKIASERAEFERTQAKLVEAAKHAATGAAEDEIPKEVQNLADQLMGIP